MSDEYFSSFVYECTLLYTYTTVLIPCSIQYPAGSRAQNPDTGTDAEAEVKD